MTMAGVTLSSSDKLLNIVSLEHWNTAVKVHNKMNNSAAPALAATSKSQKCREMWFIQTLSDEQLLKATVASTTPHLHIHVSFSTTFKVIISDIFT